MSIEALYPIIKPSLNLDFASTKTLDPRITFTRASTGTYYDGVTTAMAEQNLLLRSQTFVNASWVKSGSALNSTTVAAPDGTLTAANATINASSFGVYQLNSISVATGQKFQLSVWLKAASNTTINIGINGQVNGLNNKGTQLNITTAWVRYVYDFEAGASDTGLFAFIAATASIGSTPAINDSRVVDIWGAQLEQRSSVTAYTPTTTQPITNYVPVLRTAQAGQARFDHNPTTGESLGLLVEEQRTNLMTYSQAFDTVAIWTASNLTVSANTIVAPDGTLTGDKLIENTSASIHYVNGSGGAISNSTAYTGSVYLKAGERTWALILLELGAANFKGFFVNLSTGVLGSQFGSGSTATVTNAGNGWYRVAVTTTSTGTTAGFRVYLATGDGVTTYTGDGYSGFYIWGAQLEAGSFPTSYIPTVASQVTRSADNATILDTNFTQWYNQSAGSLYVDGNIPLDVDSPIANYYAAISDGTNSNLINIVDTNGARSQVITMGVSQYDSGAIVPEGPVKAVVSFATNDTVFCANTTLGTVDTVSIPPSVNRLSIGVRGDNANTSQANGTIKRISYYPYRQSNTQLQALTS